MKFDKDRDRSNPNQRIVEEEIKKETEEVNDWAGNQAQEKNPNEYSRPVLEESFNGPKKAEVSGAPNVIMRELATSDSDVLQVLRSGTPITVERSVGDYYAVRGADNHHGYIMKKYVTIK